MHADSNTAVTGCCRIPYSDSIILCGCFKSDGGRIVPVGQGIHAGGQGIFPFGAVVVIIVPRRGVGGIDTVEMGLHLAEGISHSPAGDEPLVATLDLAGTNSTAPGFRIGGLFFICRIPQLHGAGLFILDITIGIFDRHLGEIRTDIGSIRRSSQRLQLFHNHRVMGIYAVCHFHEAIVGSGAIGLCCKGREYDLVVIPDVALVYHVIDLPIGDYLLIRIIPRTILFRGSLLPGNGIAGNVSLIVA